MHTGTPRSELGEIDASVPITNPMHPQLRSLAKSAPNQSAITGAFRLSSYGMTASAGDTD
jgi:hypothetical protein